MDRSFQVPYGLLVVARNQAGLVSTKQCKTHGVTDHRRRRLVAIGTWERLARGVYDTRKVNPALHPLDIRRLRRVWLGQLACPRGVLLGSGALVAAGVAGVPVDFDLEMAFPNKAHYRSRVGVRVRQVDVRGYVTKRDGAYLVRIDLALAQAAATLTRDQWLACADSVIHQRLLDRNLQQVRRHMIRLRCADSKLDLVELVDGRSESPIESRARLRCIDAGIAPDDIQRKIFGDNGRFLGRADLAWYLGDGRWLLVEIDGNEFHRSDEHLHRDATRQNGLVLAGEHVILRYRAHHLRSNAMAAEIGVVLEREHWVPGRMLPSMMERHDVA